MPADRVLATVRESESGGSEMSSTYAVDSEGAASAGGRFGELARPCKEVGTALKNAGVRPVDVITISADALAFLNAFSDATKTLGSAFGYLGSGVEVAAARYRATDAQASENYALTRRQVRGI